MPNLTLRRSTARAPRLATAASTFRTLLALHRMRAAVRRTGDATRGVGESALAAPGALRAATWPSAGTWPVTPGRVRARRLRSRRRRQLRTGALVGGGALAAAGLAAGLVAAARRRADAAEDASAGAATASPTPAAAATATAPAAASGTDLGDFAGDVGEAAAPAGDFEERQWDVAELRERAELVAGAPVLVVRRSRAAWWAAAAFVALTAWTGLVAWGVTELTLGA